MNFDLALIYDTDGAFEEHFEKVAAAGQQARRPNLQDYAVHLTYGDEVPEEVDIEKVAATHDFLLEHDRAGRAYAQLAFSELEARVLAGDAEALTAMGGFLGGAQPARESEKVAALRAEIARRLGLEKGAGAGGYIAGRLARGKGRAVGYAMKDGAESVGIKNLAKGMGREFKGELAAGALGAAAGGVAGTALGGRKTTVVYR